jgi:uncharacterized protein (DUF2147 family)
MKHLIALLMIVLAVPALAQGSPVGLWKTVDDTTGREKGLVRIVAENGVLTGRIEGTLEPGEPRRRTCELCTDDRRDKPLLGMAILRGVRASTDDPGIWDGGDILDPDSGKVYRVRLKLLGDGRELQVRGYIGVPMLGRTQVWRRAE